MNDEQLLNEPTKNTAPARPVEYEGSRFEALVDQAYARWQRIDCDRLTWLLHLDAAQRCAAVLAGYIAQVNNGGHLQWLDNGYHAADRVFLDFALDRLAEHDRDAAEQAKRLIHKAGLQEDVVVNSCDEDDWEQASADLDVWDNQFYDTKLADRLTGAAESYFGAAGV